jgi:hypothetical protein
MEERMTTPIDPMAAVKVLHDGPELAPVARIYTQGRYRRASVLGGPGEPLVRLSDAARWRQVAELRQAMIEQLTVERDAALAATAHIEAPTSEPVRYELRMVAPNGKPAPWGGTSKEAFDKFRANPDIGDGFRYDVRALHDHAAPQALPATEQAEPRQNLSKKNHVGAGLRWAEATATSEPDQCPIDTPYGPATCAACLAVQAKPDLSGLRQYTFNGMGREYFAVADVHAHFDTQPVAQAKPDASVGWVSVADRLPADGVEVEVAVIGPAYNDWSKGRYVDRATYHNGAFYSEDGDELYPPSYWCELPPATATTTNTGGLQG